MSFLYQKFAKRGWFVLQHMLGVQQLYMIAVPPVSMIWEVAFA
jgi:hypothetical protein